ncbi:hypothetical protein BDZ89DRAFT_1112282 [Hymenopellis radicata]|nr:hypothetical protein BDZ89DRAFT_1112282 [Hymenopellis radicata]
MGMLAVQADISAKQMSLLHMSVHKRILEDIQRDHSGAMSPIRRLPIELIGEIFRHCMGSVPYDVNSTFSGPRSLMRVCRRWYQVADAFCPSIWTNMHITNVFVKDPVSLVETSLRRSRQHLLSITIRVEVEDTSVFALGTSFIYFPIHGILRLLARHSARWEILDATLGPKIDWLTLWHGTWGNVPNLRKLVLHNANSTDAEESSIPWLQRDHREEIDTFAGATSLCGVSLSGWTREYMFMLPFHHLSSFSCINTSINDPYLTDEECLEIFRTEHPLLRQLEFTETVPRTSEQSVNIARVTNRIVTHLVTNRKPLIEGLCLPFLLHLALRTVSPENSFNQSDLLLGPVHSMLEASRCFSTLTTLELHNIEFAYLNEHVESSLRTLLQASHSLRKLAIHVDPWDFEDESDYISYDADFVLFFRDLNEISNEPDSDSDSDSGYDTLDPQFTFLPALEDFSLVIKGFREESEMTFAFLDGDPEFSDVVALRLTGPLKSFSVQVFGIFDKELLDELKNTLAIIEKLGGCLCWKRWSKMMDMIECRD